MSAYDKAVEAAQESGPHMYRPGASIAITRGIARQVLAAALPHLPERKLLEEITAEIGQAVLDDLTYGQRGDILKRIYERADALLSQEER